MATPIAAAEGKTTIGLAAICANWFQEVGLQSAGGDLGNILRQDYARMVRLLEQCFGRVVAPGVISTVEGATQAARQFRENKIDALLLVHIMWSEDQPLLALLQECRQRLPLLLWDYHPTGMLPPYLAMNDLFRLSGTVGLLQGSAPLQRLGVRFHLVSGTPDDASLRAALQEYDLALRIHQEFQGMTVAQIAGRCEAMTGTHVDADRLREGLGAHLLSISAAEYAAVCEGVPPQRVESYYQDLLDKFPVEGVSEESLYVACRNTLALDDLVLAHDLHAVAIQDLDEDLHRLAGVRPCLCPPVSAERGVAYGMEGDLHTTLGVLAAMRARSGPCMYTEVFTFDPRENVLLMGHAGVHDPRLAARDGVTIVPDGEYRHADRYEGAWQEFILAEGPVTCASLYDTGQGYRLTLFEGQSLGCPRKLQGFAHALVRPDVPVQELIARLVQRGMTQHFAVAPGLIGNVLARWCQLSNIHFYWER